MYFIDSKSDIGALLMLQKGINVKFSHNCSIMSFYKKLLDLRIVKMRGDKYIRCDGIE
jgi:hypothetical protein